MVFFQIEIPKRAGVCAHGGELMAPGMTYYSSLVLRDEDGGFDRHDYCAACWEQLTQKGEKISTWKSAIPAKKVASDLPKKRDDRAYYLLKESLASDGVLAREEAFVLSLYLARRRRIFLRQEMARNDQKFQLYEVAETEEMLCVPKVELSHLQVESLQLELAKKFNESGNGN